MQEVAARSPSEVMGVLEQEAETAWTLLAPILVQKEVLVVQTKGDVAALRV